MKPDFNALKFAMLKKELKRIANVDTLKTELQRLSAEIMKFDLAAKLPPDQKARLQKRYRFLKATLADLQKRLDKSFERFAALARRAPAKKTARKSARKPQTTAKRSAKPRKKARTR